MAAIVPDPIESKKAVLRGISQPVELIIGEEGEAKSLLPNSKQKGTRGPHFSFPALEDKITSMEDSCQKEHFLDEHRSMVYYYCLRDPNEHIKLYALPVDIGERAYPYAKLMKIREFECARQVSEKGYDWEVTRYDVPYKTQLVDGSVLDPSFYNGTSNGLANTRASSNGILKHNHLFNTVALKQNAQTIIVSSGGGYPFCSYSTGEFIKLSPESDVFAAKSAEERVTAGDLIAVYLDSGASVHVTGEKTMLKGYKPLTDPWQIAVADGHPLCVVGVGTIKTPDGNFTIPNVPYVEGLKNNLISVSQLDRDNGLFSGFHSGMCEIMTRERECIGGGFLQANGLYKLRFLQVPEN